jgi:hypothetical protein
MSHSSFVDVPLCCTLFIKKCTLVQGLGLCTDRTARRGSRNIALLFHDHGTRKGWGVSVTPRPLVTPGKDPVPNVQEAGCAPGPAWTDAENLAPTGIRSPDCPARSQSRYLLSTINHEQNKLFLCNDRCHGDVRYFGCYITQVRFVLFKTAS